MASAPGARGTQCTAGAPGPSPKGAKKVANPRGARRRGYSKPRRVARRGR